MRKETKQRIKMAGLAGVALAVAAALAGCSSSSTFGSPSKSAQNNYFAVGSDLGMGTGPHKWAISMDRSSSYFSAEDITVNEGFTSVSPMKGTFTTVNGFDVLTAQSGYGIYTNYASGSGPVGPAVEIPGEAAVLVSPPAVYAASPVYPAFAVASNKCSALSGNNTFQFLELPLVDYVGSVYDTAPQPVYGSVQATSTANADGSVAWKFSNFSTTTATGVTATQPAESGLCANSPTSAGYVVNLSDQSANIGISPSGFFVWRVINSTLECGSYVRSGNTGDCAALGYVGFLAPSSPMDTSKLVAGKFGGAELDTSGVNGAGGEITRPVVFGATAGTGTTMTGGVFPNDDTTQAPDSGISINLGTQSTTTNGFYPSVSVTLPNTTAPLTGIAIAGSPGGNNAVFVAVNDGADTLFFFFLYQQ